MENGSVCKIKWFAVRVTCLMISWPLNILEPFLRECKRQTLVIPKWSVDFALKQLCFLITKISGDKPTDIFFVADPSRHSLFENGFCSIRRYFRGIVREIDIHLGHTEKNTVESDKGEHQRCLRPRCYLQKLCGLCRASSTPDFLLNGIFLIDVTVAVSNNESRLHQLVRTVYFIIN